MSQNICNICGANYEYRNGRWKCPACGAFKAEELSNEEVTLFYNAAQKLRLCDFDEAEKAYTDIIEKFPKNPNGYWERLLSRYGIKYEEDFDGRKIPTCYAASIESVLNDKDYIKALSLADADTKVYFEQQAQYIERVRKEWIERAKKEKPYDIFICYKDSDRANGIERTQDSIAAQDLYIHLTEQGYRVFFSRESLRDKVGEKYEPYIFNALSTAKVMLVYGTSSEYITSTWLKNEWTRYEKRLQAGEKKPNSLIVACDGFAPNELPKTLSSMQCFDATRRSFYTDLDTVLKRIIKFEEKPKFTSEQPKKETVKQAPTTDTAPKQSPSSNQKAMPKKPLPKNAKIAIVTVIIIAIIGILGALGQLGSDNTVDSLIDSKYGVTITASDKIFDADAKITVGKTTDGVEHRSWVNAVNNSKDIELQNTIVYDITCDANITKNVTVKVPYSKTSSNTEVKVFYVSDNKATIEEHNCSYANSFVEFETNHFSHYVIGEVEKSASGSGSEQTKEPNAPTLEYGILQVGVCADYPPYEYMESGEYKGIEIDIIKAIAVELGLEVRFENDSFEDLLTNLTNKSVDCIIGVTETEERNELASPSYTMFAEDDYKYIIYFDKSSTELKTKVNETINKLRTDGTINTIYKQYTVKSGSVKVIFDPNGGEGTRIIEFAEKNTSITMKDTVFTRPGYTFLGWGKYPGGEALYKVGTYYEVGGNSEYVLYAIWTENENTIVFNANGGEGTMESMTLFTGSGNMLPYNQFTKEGYHFLGWHTDPTSTVALYEDRAFYWMGTEPTVTLYAIWKKQLQSVDTSTITVCFYPNGGNGTAEEISVPYAASNFVLPSCKFTREGYKFIGWGDSETSPTNVFKVGETCNLLNYSKLYAIWELEEYKANFKADGNLIAELLFTVETESLSGIPNVPTKQCYVGVWENYELGASDIIIEAQYTLSHSSISYVDAKNSQCNFEGNVAHWHCSGCNNNYQEEAGTTLLASVSLEVVGCVYDDGKCKWCGKDYVPILAYDVCSSLYGNGYKVVGLGEVTGEEIIIPDYYNGLPVVEIGDRAFKDATWITKVTLPNTVQHIGGQAFYGCSNLSSIEFGTGLKTVASDAFNYCSLLTEVYVTDINAYAAIDYYGWTSLPFYNGFGSYADKETKLYVNRELVTDVVIAGSVSKIGQMAFAFCDSIKTVTLSEGVCEIDRYAFAHCDNLISMHIPHSVTTIDYDVIESESLQYITYNGTRGQWLQIDKDVGWDTYVDHKYLVKCIDGDIEES